MNETTSADRLVKARERATAAMRELFGLQIDHAPIYAVSNYILGMEAASSASAARLQQQLALALAALKPFAELWRKYDEYYESHITNESDTYSILAYIEGHAYWSCVPCFEQEVERAADALKSIEEAGAE